MPSSKSITARAPQRKRGELRVAALQDAALAVFAEKGFEAATMTQIAARAGAPIGSLYQFFPNKDVLADALIDRYAGQLGDALDALEAALPGLSTAALANALLDLFPAVARNATQPWRWSTPVRIGTPARPSCAR